MPEGRVNKLQGDLVGYAQQMSYTQLQIVCRRAVEVIDPTPSMPPSNDSSPRRSSKPGRGGVSVPAHQRRSRVLRADARGPVRDAPRVAGGDQLPPHHTTTQPPTELSLDDITETATTTDPDLPVLPVAGWDDGLRDLTYQQRLRRAMCTLVEHLPTDELPRRGMDEC